MKKYIITFPSPVGELHFSMIILELKRWFPSPVGELHFSISKALTFRYRENHVSVPCRGTTFLNLKKLSVENYKKVSVPCRGTTFLNSRLVDSSNRTQRFRPLSGNYISQYKKHNLKQEENKVSVPCRGTTFLNLPKSIKYAGELSFRPLSGNYISQ